MEHLTDFTITQVFEGPSGEGPHGPYQIYNFYTDKTAKKKFSWFGGDKKILPVEGMKIDYMEWEEEQKGKFTNCTVKKLALKEEEKPSPVNSSQTTSQPQPVNGQVSYYVSYVKDIAVAMIEHGGGDLKLKELDNIARKVGKAGLIMMNESLPAINTPPEAQNAPKVANKPKAEGTILSPENEKLKKRLQGYAEANKEKYFAVLGQHGVEKGEEVYGFALGAQVSLLNDLEKELGDIPF